jgi:hypothetical protein
VCPVKALEDALLSLAGDPDPVVDDRDDRASFLRSDLDRDLAARRRVADRVIEQRLDDLLEAL